MTRPGTRLDRTRYNYVRVTHGSRSVCLPERAHHRDVADMQFNSGFKVVLLALAPQALPAATLSAIAGLPEPSMTVMVTVGLGLIALGKRQKRV